LLIKGSLLCSELLTQCFPACLEGRFVAVSLV
jgi:hypothetical protein